MTAHKVPRCPKLSADDRAVVRFVAIMLVAWTREAGTGSGEIETYGLSLMRSIRKTMNSAARAAGAGGRKGAK